ncbi:flavodoxin [Candidatus Bathyarchaeota archaeon]|nr:flavodoxin [Candidatus Bathyarchaeota archaeon]
MNQILVTYYSLEGNTKLVAEVIADAIDADILRLVPVKDVNPEKGSRYFWGGKQVLMRQKPELEPFHVDPREYQVHFIGTPVWAWRYAPALRTFFHEIDLKGKKIAIFSTHDGGPGKTLAKMKEKLDGNTIIGEIEFYKPLENMDSICRDAITWASSILDGARNP